MSKVIGIDLGTTNACVAVFDGEKLVVIPNPEGSRTTPCIVTVTDSGERLVGSIAKRQSVTNSRNTISAMRRYIGRKYASKEVATDIQSAPYEVIEGENGEAWVRMGDQAYSPQEIAAIILVQMKEISEGYLGEAVTEAVITVPASFDDAQRSATKEAGRIAGLDVRQIIDEPTAAALAYGLEKRTAVKVAVYHMGGSTFHVSVLQLRDGVFEVLSTNGDSHLGGDDFDLEIINHLAEEFASQHGGIDLRKDKFALQRLTDAAETAKRELSSSIETQINLPFIIADQSGPKHLMVTLTRHDLERLVEPLIQRSMAPCKQAMIDAILAPEDIDEVLLVGGQTRMPRVRQVVRSFFDKEPNQRLSPDEVVAIGAAIQGRVLRRASKIDVNPLALGVETAGGVFHPIIPRNTTLPAERSMVFSTARDNQAVVDVHVLQGERLMAEDNETLGRFQLVGIPPSPRGVPNIEVTFEIDGDRVVHVSAKYQNGGKSQQVKMVMSSGSSEAEIERMVHEAETSRQLDEAKKRLAQARSTADGLLDTTEQSLEEYDSRLAQIREDWKSLKAVRNSSDVGAIQDAIQRLEGSSHEVFAPPPGPARARGRRLIRIVDLPDAISRPLTRRKPVPSSS